MRRTAAPEERGQIVAVRAADGAGDLLMIVQCVSHGTFRHLSQIDNGVLLRHGAGGAEQRGDQERAARLDNKPHVHSLVHGEVHGGGDAG